MQAFMSGNLKIMDNVMLAQKLGHILESACSASMGSRQSIKHTAFLLVAFVLSPSLKVGPPPPPLRAMNRAP